MSSLRLLPLVICIALLVLFWGALSRDPHVLPSAQLGQPLPMFEWPVLGRPDQTITSNQMRGEAYVLNVWASWCAACRQEQVFLLKLARSGIKIYGLNYKDQTDDALRWLKAWGNPYVLIGEDADGHRAIDLGVYGTPETFLIDASGRIVYRHAGVLTERVWQDDFLPRLKVSYEKK